MGKLFANAIEDAESPFRLRPITYHNGDENHDAPPMRQMRRAHRLLHDDASLPREDVPSTAESMAVVRMSKNICPLCDRGYLEVATRELRVALPLPPSTARICTWCGATTHSTTVSDRPPQ